MNHSTGQSFNKETDYLIVGAGAMGIAFADEIFTNSPGSKLTIVDRRERAGGHWNDAYPFVRLHQPAAFYGVNSLILGNGSTDLSSKPELLAYYDEILAKFTRSGRVEFLGGHDYLGNGQVADLKSPTTVTTYKINKRVVDASYMKVEVPSTHSPKYKVDDHVPLIPINELTEQYDKWEKFYVIGNGKTGMDAVLFLMEKRVPEQSIYWICPNQAWLFHRESLQVGMVGKEVLQHATHLKNASCAEEIFLAMEKSGGIIRLHKNSSPRKWRCATINSNELKQLRGLTNIIEEGRVVRITTSKIELQEGSVSYFGKTLFVDCSANALSKRKQTPIFKEDKITLQSILFCQQVFSAAAIAKLELTDLSDLKRNQIVPVPHPEFTEDWPSALAISIDNLLVAHKYFPIWMFRSRLNFMSHEPIIKYMFYAAKAKYLNSSINKTARRMNRLREA